MRLIGVSLLAYVYIQSVSVAYAGQMDMEHMMKQAKAAEACFANINQTKLAALETKGREMEQSLQALCQAGKNAEATKKAIQYSQAMMQDSSFKQIQQCAQYMDGMMPLIQPYLPKLDERSETASNVCD